MKNWWFYLLLLVMSGAWSVEGEEGPLERLVFVSCHKESRKAPALDTIEAWDPDVFIWMGDNIYGDSEDMAVLRKKYQIVLDKDSYRKISQKALILGTWDDHDYGANDVGKEFGPKVESQAEFLDFLRVGREDPRRERAGVYSMKDVGPLGKQVRLILLDTRYHRDAIGSDGSLLGEEQWAWLEESLRESPAAVNILVSSIQILPKEHRFEKWANFPTERARLLKLLAEEQVPPVLLLTGDRHLAEISLDVTSCGYPLYELTSSSLNFSFGGDPDEKNGHRLGENFGGKNFGTLTFDWRWDLPRISAEIRRENGEIEMKLPLLLKK